MTYAGVDQTDYDLDAEAQTCEFPLDPVAVRAGDTIQVRYPYRIGSPLPAPVVPPILSAANGWDLPRDTELTSLALPVGTQLGDIIVVNAIGGYSDGNVEIPDPRMTKVAHWTTHGSGPGGRRWGVFVGYATSLAPLAVQMQAEYHTTGQFAKGAIMAVRGNGAALNWDPARVAVGPNYAAGAGFMPAVPGSGSGALASVVGHHSGQLTGGWSSPAMDPYAPAKVVNGDSGTIAHLGFSGQAPTIDATLGAPNVVATWRGVVIGFE